MTTATERDRCSTGIPNADRVLDGGLLPESATLLRGVPGAGKTIFGLHALTADPADTGLYINLGEPTAYLRETAARFDRPTDGLEFLDLSPSGDAFHGDSAYDLFHADEVERSPITESIRERVDRVDPDRVLVDPITELRYLAPDERQFRTQVLGLVDFLKSRGATVVLTSQAASSVPDDDLQFLVDAVITLDVDDHRRTLSVPKFRGSAARRGPHTVTIDDAGMHVWPRLDPERHHRDWSLGELNSGVEGLDALLDGGITTGALTFLSGPTGVGKTTTALQFMTQAARRGEESVLYSFEESPQTMVARAESIGIPLRRLREAGTVVIESIGPNEMTVDEFTARLQRRVEAGVTLVAIDGVAGFERAFTEDAADPIDALVAVARYLRNVGVTGLFTNEVHRITGDFYATEQRVSHLADDIVVFRHVEYRGELQKVVGVLKRRTSAVDTGLRLFEITDDGLVVGEPRPELRGILTGTPDWDNDG